MCDKNEDSKRLKITLSFTRRYLGNRKSYRDKRKSVLKSKVARFRSSFIRPPEVNIFEVTAVQSFVVNFNRIQYLLAWKIRGLDATVIKINSIISSENYYLIFFVDFYKYSSDLPMGGAC